MSGSLIFKKEGKKMYEMNFDKPCHVHFMGIGGISMSGLAEILLQDGFTVSGSDMKDSDIIQVLRGLGASVNIGQAASNITDDIDVVVYTAAIHPDNEEFAAAKNKGIPMLTRAQLLGQIMTKYKYGIAISGTHGKTTTTSMMSHVLLNAEKDPTISIGGMLDVIGGNIRVGHSDYFVTEACEYTNSYHSFKPYISIILNVDADHLDFFKDIDEIAQSFKTFAEILPKDGLLVVNGDMKYKDFIVSDLKCPYITFGFNPENDYSATDIVFDEHGHPTYTLVVKGEKQERIALHSSGKHNVMNSLSVIAVCDFLNIERSAVAAGLLSCTSAKRRFEMKGVTENGVKILDDYAHHPTEIAATLEAVKTLDYGESWCVFQPHTYTRTYALLDQFAQALTGCDHVILADIYAAREKDNGKVSSKDLCEKINAAGGNAVYLGDFDSIEKYAKKNCQKNDLLITMGAGNVDSIGDLLLKK
jgi:UDP-N-acetylmuramate--alanine ligase